MIKSIVFRHGLCLCLTLTLTWLAACSQPADARLHLESLRSAQILLQQPDLTVVDVRTQEEWEEGHLPNATWVPPQEWATIASRVPADKPLLLVCRSGGRAQKVAQTLIEQGHPEVHVLVDAGVPELLKL